MTSNRGIISFVFHTVQRSITSISKWMKINIYGDAHNDPLWNESKRYQKIDEYLFTQNTRTIIKEGCVYGGLQHVAQYLHENALQPLCHEWEMKNEGKEFKFITLDNCQTAAPTEKMAKQLNEDFHYEYEHTWHEKAFSQIKKKVERQFTKKKKGTKMIVVAYYVNTTRADYLQNLVDADEWNQYHCEAVCMQFTDPNSCVPGYLDTNGSFKPNNADCPKIRSMYYIYIYFYNL